MIHNVYITYIRFCIDREAEVCKIIHVLSIVENGMCNLCREHQKSTKNVQSMMYNEECPMKIAFCAIKTVESTQRVQWMYNFN